MNIADTKYIVELELRRSDTPASLDRELAEFYGMLFTCDNTGERAIINRGEKRIASCGFISKKYADEYVQHHSRQLCDIVTSPVIENRFTYHSPKERQPEKYKKIRDKAKELAYLIVGECPASREQLIALERLEDAVFWANASIARN